MQKDKLYRGWQMKTDDMEKEIKSAIEFYITLYGKPPAIIEHSDKLKPPKSQVEFRGIRIPDNILFLGE